MIRWRPSQELVVLLSYTVALYMTVVDSTIIFTALPSLSIKIRRDPAPPAPALLSAPALAIASQSTRGPPVRLA